MVASGCFLDEAFGEIKNSSLDNKVKKKKKREKQEDPDVFDRSYNKMAKDIGGFIEDEEMFSEITHDEKKKEKKMMQKIEHLKEEEYNHGEKNKEYRRLLHDKDYQDYLNYDDVREDRRQQKKFKKKKGLKEAKNKRRKKKYGRKDN